ncbi:aminotransferase class V-fold PLP-dependent enzyme [Methylobacterium sp. 092160098-2]|uniref:aminotransferase class V-fold PLP-dependent enzyme n=1 Tax=Methylobacterium sp. 092160098-2 TaxID=3025129 RepID=UPI002381C0EB|nr:aminotransferase class V-fold PLP-dependent enzyme [Methylobacterium sp. 092160098-2]MDE4916005.1 aminotransferase class V-fold PLP-dependent enzyme [Methylobacterium sp. 092160098-2]
MAADISRFVPPVAVRERIVGLDRRVPVLDGSTRRYINLDNAASTPALRNVLDTVNQFMEWYASVHRGAGFKSRVATQAYEDARQTVAQFVGANPRQHVVIFGKNATEAINKLSYRLPLSPEDVVLVSQLEHHSNDLPWRARARVEHIGVDAHGGLDEVHLDRLLQTHAGRVKLVAVTGGSNVSGVMPNLQRLAVKAHAAGAQILVDCAQLAPHRGIDIGTLEDPAHLDYVTLSAHKMYAPFGTGALIGRRDTFERGEPEYRGGGTIEFVSLESVAWADAPDRDEAGTPNVVGAVALAAAMQTLNHIGMEAIARHEAELTAYALERMAQIEGLRLYGEADPARASQRLGVIAFNLEPYSHALVAAVLGTEFGIGVRNGCFCAHPYLIHLLGLTPEDVLQIRSSMAAGDRRAMPGMVRVSFGTYNTVEDIDRLAEALTAIARGEYEGQYCQDRASGEYSARGWSPDLDEHFSLGAVRRGCASEASRGR